MDFCVAVPALLMDKVYFGQCWEDGLKWRSPNHSGFLLVQKLPNPQRWSWFLRRVIELTSPPFPTQPSTYRHREPLTRVMPETQHYGLPPLKETEPVHREDYNALPEINWALCRISNHRWHSAGSKKIRHTWCSPEPNCLAAHRQARSHRRLSNGCPVQSLVRDALRVLNQERKSCWTACYSLAGPAQ